VRHDEKLPETNLQPTVTGFVVWGIGEVILFFAALAVLLTADYSSPIPAPFLGWRGVVLAILGLALVIVGRRLLDRWLLRFKRESPRI
jgi:hypothetical protein